MSSKRSFTYSTLKTIYENFMTTQSMKKAPLLAAMVGAFATMTALAADTLETQDVVVTATRVARELMDVNMSVSVVTAEEIERSGAQTIADLIKDLPGVEINTDGSQGMKRIQIRGENAFRTLIMIDGQRMTEQKSMSGTPILIDPSQIERIEVIKGPASVLYGADALGGAINIITKKGGSDRVQGTASVGLNSSNNGGSASASIFGKAGDFHYRLGAAYEGGRDLKLAHGKAPGTDFESKAANAYLAYDINANHTVGLTADYFDLDFNSSAYPQYSAEDFYVHVPSWKRTKVGIFDEIRYVNDYLAKVRTDFFYQKSTKLMENYVHALAGRGSVTNDNTADNTLKQFGGSIQADWTLGDKLYLITGYDITYEKLDAGTTSDTTVVMGQTITTNKVWSYRGDLLTQALYASGDYQLSDQLTLNAGARYTFVRTNMKEAAGASVSSQGTSALSAQTGEETDGRMVFNAGLIWRPVTELALRAAWTQGFRTPLLQERFLDTTMGQANSMVKGNPNLKPETSNNFELGARWIKGGATVDASVFYNLAEDYITTEQLNATTYQYNNVAKANTLGLELAGSYRIGMSGFEPHITLTALRRELKQDGVSTTATATPKLRATYGVRWRGDVALGRLSTDLFARSATSADSYSFSTGNTTSYDSWTTLNFTAGLDFGAQKAYSLNVGFYNLTNTDYVTPQSSYEAGRYAEVKFTARF